MQFSIKLTSKSCLTVAHPTVNRCQTKNVLMIQKKYSGGCLKFQPFLPRIDIAWGVSSGFTKNLACRKTDNQADVAMTYRRTVAQMTYAKQLPSPPLLKQLQNPSRVQIRDFFYNPSAGLFEEFADFIITFFVMFAWTGYCPPEEMRSGNAD